jgi:hypothetical protein
VSMWRRKVCGFGALEVLLEFIHMRSINHYMIKPHHWEPPRIHSDTQLI